MSNTPLVDRLKVCLASLSDLSQDYSDEEYLRIIEISNAIQSAIQNRDIPYIEALIIDAERITNAKQQS